LLEANGRRIAARLSRRETKPGDVLVLVDAAGLQRAQE